MITLDEQSRIPIYEQIINEVKRNVLEGFLKPKDQIPSIRELANTLGINPNTVKKSYTALENQNIETENINPNIDNTITSQKIPNVGSKTFFVKVIIISILFMIILTIFNKR